MSNKTTLEKKYSLSHNELYELADRIIVAMRRDIADFAQFKIVQANITALELLSSEFLELLNDQIYKDEYSYAIQLRDQLREVLYNKLKRISLAAKSVYKNQKAIQKTLRIKYGNRLNDRDFAIDAGYIYEDAVTHALELEDEGITAAYLAELNTNLTDFKNSLQVVDQKFNIREQKTEERIHKANELYSTLVKYCDYGKYLYEEVSPAKYYDYVINQASPGALKPPANLTFHFKERAFTWDIVKYATSFQLEYSQDGENFEEVYSGIDTSCVFTPPNEGWGYYRVRGRNSNGYGPYSPVLKQGYYAVLPPPSEISLAKVPGTDNVVRITWNEVPSALKYAVYLSTVPIGSPANTYNFVGRFEQTTHDVELELGKRHWFQLTAESNVQWSNRSAAIYIDMQ